MIKKKKGQGSCAMDTHAKVQERRRTNVKKGTKREGERDGYV